MDLDAPTNSSSSHSQSLLALVATNTASLRRNSIELKELLVALQQQVNDLSEQVILLQAQVSDLSGQLVVERQRGVLTSPSHASLQQEGEGEDVKRERRKMPRVRYYRHDSGPPGLGSAGFGVGGNRSGDGGGGNGEQTVNTAD